MTTDRTSAVSSLVRPNMFIPISLGNHYYSLEILKRLLSDFVAKSNVAVIFLCDRLRLLSYQIRGEADIRRIESNIKLQLNELTRSLINVGFGFYPNVIIANWSFLLDDHRYIHLLASLESWIREDQTLHQQLGDHATGLIDRFRVPEGADIQSRIVLQRQYVIEETALSLYMTEIREFNVEVYRRGMGFVDALYRERPVELMSLVCKSKLDRKFISLENWISSQPLLTCPRIFGPSIS
jgi:tRNA-dependent cyclodipeptide synthase